MKQLITSTSIILVFALLVVQKADAQRDSIKVEKDVVIDSQQDSIKVERVMFINAQQDTTIISQTVPRYTRMGGRKRGRHIERKITINSDGDTTEVRVAGDRRIRMSRSQNRRHQVRQRFEHSTRMHSSQRHRHQVVRESPGCGMRMWNRMHEMHQNEDARELWKMEMEARQIALELRQADEDRYDEIEAKLRAHLEEIFEHKYDMKMESVGERQRNLEVQRATLEERQSNREEIIEDRIQQLLGHGSSYRW